MLLRNDSVIVRVVERERERRSSIMTKEAELSDAAREARNAYLREWRKNNPQKTKKHRVDYWERKVAESTEGNK